MSRIIMRSLLVLSILFAAEEAPGADYYRWLDDDGVIQLSDQPPVDRKYERTAVPDGASGEKTGLIPGEISPEELSRAAAGEQAKTAQRRDEVVKGLEALVVHYSDAGGITSGKLAALREAVEVVKNARMTGGEADDEFYLKIEELVRACKDHTATIGRVNRLLREAKAMKGFPVEEPPAE